MKALGLFTLLLASVAAHAAAPFYQNFHNVPVKTVKNNFDYYLNQGLGARTLSIYRTGFLKPTYAAGAFDRASANTNQATFFEPLGSWGDSFQAKDRAGYRAREISGYLGDENVNGAPGRINLTTIWERKDRNATAAYVGLNEEAFNAKYDEYVVRGGYRPYDHFSYYEYGVIRHTVLFIKDGAGFMFYRAMTAPQFNDRLKEMSAKGFIPANLNVQELPNGFYYSCIWKKSTAAHAIYYGLTGDQYQQKWQQLNAQGYKLMKIQGYNKGTQFAAIWEK